MKKNLSKKEIIQILALNKQYFKKQFGVVRIGLFGSYAKNKNNPESDIDIFVELAEPRFEWLMDLNIFLEQQFNAKVDIIRKGNHIKESFLKTIEKELTYV
ncbi:MAG: toxin-antitoxin system toxin subunit [Cytophagales bacterium]|nr:toxin-antitoxin system toxin subunit [Cytophagales bacterium]